MVCDHKLLFYYYPSGMNTSEHNSRCFRKNMYMLSGKMDHAISHWDLARRNFGDIQRASSSVVMALHAGWASRYYFRALELTCMVHRVEPKNKSLMRAHDLSIKRDACTWLVCCEVFRVVVFRVVVFVRQLNCISRFSCCPLFLL